MNAHINVVLLLLALNDDRKIEDATIKRIALADDNELKNENMKKLFSKYTNHSNSTQVPLKSLS